MRTFWPNRVFVNDKYFQQFTEGRLINLPSWSLRTGREAHRVTHTSVHFGEGFHTCTHTLRNKVSHFRHFASQILLNYNIIWFFQGSHFPQDDGDFFHYRNITITVIVACVWCPVVSLGVEGKTIAGSEKQHSQKSLSLNSSLRRTPLSPFSLFLKSVQLSDVSAKGCWKHFGYKNYIRAKESGLEKTATLARQTLSLTALWAVWHYKTGDTSTSNR